MLKASYPFSETRRSGSVSSLRCMLRVSDLLLRVWCETLPFCLCMWNIVQEKGIYYASWKERTACGCSKYSVKSMLNWSLRHWLVMTEHRDGWQRWDREGHRKPKRSWRNWKVENVCWKHNAENGHGNSKLRAHLRDRQEQWRLPYLQDDFDMVFGPLWSGHVTLKMECVVRVEESARDRRQGLSAADAAVMGCYDACVHL